MRLLALVDSPDHVCCRYRVRAFEPACKAWLVSDCQELKRGSTFSRLARLFAVSSYESVILQRKLLPAWQLAILRTARHLVFDFDDAVLFRDSYAPGAALIRTCGKSGSPPRSGLPIRSSRVTISWPTVLSGRERRLASPGDPDLRGTRQLYPEAAPLPAGQDDAGRCDLVWIGSSSTLRGLEQQQPLWDRLGREIPGLRMRVICDKFPGFQTLRVVPVPWAQAWEARDLAAGQIGISWLPEDPWSQGKCGLKVLQYQAARLPVVANPVGMHAELIEPGLTGFLPRTADQWVEAIRTLAADEKLRRRMGRTRPATCRDGLFRRGLGRDLRGLGCGGGKNQPRPEHAVSTLRSGVRFPTRFTFVQDGWASASGVALSGRLDGNRDNDDPTSPDHSRICS